MATERGGKRGEPAREMTGRVGRALRLSDGGGRWKIKSFMKTAVITSRQRRGQEADQSSGCLKTKGKQSHESWKAQPKPCP